MNVPVVMPQLGLTMTEGTVSEWLKKPGETVEKNEPIFVVSTDKADMEVESAAEGIVSEIVVEAGRPVPVGTVLAYVEQAAGGPAAAPHVVNRLQSSSVESSQSEPPQEVAREHGGGEHHTQMRLFLTPIRMALRPLREPADWPENLG